MLDTAFEAFGQLDFYQTAQFVKECAEYFAWKYSRQIERLDGGSKGVEVLAHVILLRIINFITHHDHTVAADSAFPKRLVENWRISLSNSMGSLRDWWQKTSTPQERQEQKALLTLVLQGVYRGACDAEIENKGLQLDEVKDDRNCVGLASQPAWRCGDLINNTRLEIVNHKGGEESVLYGHPNCLEYYGYCYGLDEDLEIRPYFTRIVEQPALNRSSLPNLFSSQKPVTGSSEEATAMRANTKESRIRDLGKKEEKGKSEASRNSRG